MNENKERVIDLKDLIYRIVRNWRKVIVGAVIIAVLAALLQVFSGIRFMLNEEALAEAQKRYEIRLNDYQATGERLRTKIANLQDQSANQQEYNDKSQLMKIDPMNKWVGDFQFYIDSKYQIDPSLTFQNTDRTNRLIAAYASYLRSGELYGEILANNSSGIDEIRFLTEVYGINVDTGAATISVSCVGATDKEVAELLDFVKSKIAERYELILSAIGDHSYDILTESVYSIIDLALDERQKANTMAITEYANAIGETNEELTEWEQSPGPSKEFGTWYTAKKSIKALVFGGIAGVAIMIVWFAAAYCLSSTMKTDGDWKQYGIAVLGHISRVSGKKHFKIIDRKIDRLFGIRRRESLDETCTLAARSLEPVLKEQGIRETAIVSGLTRPEGETLAQKMDAAAEGISIRYAGDILRDPAAVKELEQTEKVLLLGEKLVTKGEEMEQILTLIKAWGKTILGVVVVE